MHSLWLDELDLPQHDSEGDADLQLQLEELKERWLFEFDTVENRQQMKAQFRELITSHISRKRDTKIDSLLDDKSKGIS